MRRAYAESMTIYGQYACRNIYAAYGKPTTRRAKYRESTQTQKNLNDFNAKERLNQILCANFTEEDVSFVLSYDEDHKPETDADAMRTLRNFVRRLKRACEKKNLPAPKYVISTERGEKSGRYHHHTVLSCALKLGEIQKIWGCGYLRQAKPLLFDEYGLTGIAKYFPKKPITARHWTESLGLVHPEKSAPKDAGLSHKAITELAKDSENYTLWDKTCPDGYAYAGARIVSDDGFGGIYIRAYYYKPERTSIENHPRRRDPYYQPRCTAIAPWLPAVSKEEDE